MPLDGGPRTSNLQVAATEFCPKFLAELAGALLSARCQLLLVALNHRACGWPVNPACGLDPSTQAVRFWRLTCLESLSGPASIGCHREPVSHAGHAGIVAGMGCRPSCHAGCAFGVAD